MAYIKQSKISVNVECFDFERAHEEFQVLCLWNEVPECLKTKPFIATVLSLVQSSPELVFKMSLRSYYGK